MLGSENQEEQREVMLPQHTSLLASIGTDEEQQTATAPKGIS